MIDKLKAYGLNKYESYAYEALICTGVTTANNVANRSGVPHGRIYPVLSSLERKGFVKMAQGRPKRFSAVEPRIALRTAVVREEKNLEGMKQEKDRMIRLLESLKPKGYADIEDSIQVIEGYKNYLNISAELHGYAKKEWLSISRLPVYKPHLDSYRECVKRKVDVKILANGEPAEENLRAWKRTGAGIRITNPIDTRFSVIDCQEVIIRFSSSEKYLVLWIRNKSLAISMRDYFVSLWKKAKKA
ncbi:TrmB family transcriptional regulator [Candidatus Woesearchaeota archaeon]|nr:TrmB family transcriptional regulator [Candidatus Woesearchaeota archaeon]